jgi:hypothetical protein
LNGTTSKNANSTCTPGKRHANLVQELDQLPIDALLLGLVR